MFPCWVWTSIYLICTQKTWILFGGSDKRQENALRFKNVCRGGRSLNSIWQQRSAVTRPCFTSRWWWMGVDYFAYFGSFSLKWQKPSSRCLSPCLAPAKSFKMTAVRSPRGVLRQLNPSPGTGSPRADENRITLFLLAETNGLQAELAGTCTRSRTLCLSSVVCLHVVRAAMIYRKRFPRGRFQR